MQIFGKGVATLVSVSSLLGSVSTSSLNSLCSPKYVASVLPTSDFGLGISIAKNVSASPVFNYSSPSQVFFPGSTIDFCNVTLSYSHNGLNDEVLLRIWLPSPEKFEKRWLSTGGGGYAINSEERDLPGGVMYGAAVGITDGGFGGFDIQLDNVQPIANGTSNLQAIQMFGYQAMHELSLVGKELTKSFFNLTSSSKLYAYYQGCSEGGREGLSQIQRFPDEWDGAIIGAPAIRMGHQQVNHLFPGVVEKTMGYYPPPCELEKIMNLTIGACDELDGRKDGVVSRTDLCKLHFDINSTIGEPYYCSASSKSTILRKRQALESSRTPEQNGTVSAKGVAVAAALLDGLHDDQGRRAYFWYQPTAEFSDAQTQYNSSSKEWGLSITSLGGEWVTKFLELVDVDNLSTLDDVTYNTVRDWMLQGWQRYEDTLQTTWPDLTKFSETGGKIIHVHGESDPSIPPASSVRYIDSVRKSMFGDLGYNQSMAALQEFYRLYLVPGAGHCSPGTYQPGPWPQNTLLELIDWVEHKNAPEKLNATVESGNAKNEDWELCAFPSRPLWKNGTLTCVYDQKSLGTWMYDLDAFNVTVY